MLRGYLIFGVLFCDVICYVVPYYKVLFCFSGFRPRELPATEGTDHVRVPAASSNTRAAPSEPAVLREGAVASVGQCPGRKKSKSGGVGSGPTATSSHGDAKAALAELMAYLPRCVSRYLGLVQNYVHKCALPKFVYTYQSLKAVSAQLYRNHESVFTPTQILRLQNRSMRTSADRHATTSN